MIATQECTSTASSEGSMKALSWGRLAGAARAHSSRFVQCFPAILQFLSTRIGIDIMKSNSNRDRRSKRNRFASGLQNLFHMQGQTPRAPAGPVQVPGTARLVAERAAHESRILQWLGRQGIHRDGGVVPFSGVHVTAADIEALRAAPPDTDSPSSLHLTPRRDNSSLYSDSDGNLFRLSGGRITIGSPVTVNSADIRNITARNITAQSTQLDRLIAENQAARERAMNVYIPGDRIDAIDAAQLNVSSVNDMSIRDSRGNVVFSAGRGRITIRDGTMFVGGREPTPVTLPPPPPPHPETGKVINTPLRTVFGHAVEEVRNEDGTVSIRRRSAARK